MTKARMIELCNEKIAQMERQRDRADRLRQNSAADRYDLNRLAMIELRMVLEANWQEERHES